MTSGRVLMTCALVLAARCASAQGLPPAVEAALTRAGIARESVSLLVTEVDGKLPARLEHRATVPVNPASIAKLATTFAALELLGPQFTWSTPVYFDGAVREGTLHGNLYIKGHGDPKFVVERLWLLLRRIQQLGVRTIAGDIVLDGSAFQLAAVPPGAFDGEALRPYNATPEALLLNFKALALTFTPRNAQTWLQLEPPMAGLQWPATVPLSAGPCNDWRAALKADFSDPTQLRFAGAYPAACGEQTWPVAYAEPRSFAWRAVAGMWQQVGGTLQGQVREGQVPAGLTPAFESRSPPLAEIVRDINKFSNNVMAQQLFLTMGLQQKGSGTLEASREVLRQWWQERLGPGELPTFDNGSGLSRLERISARQLARLLQLAWASPLMPELMSSLPVVGVDGTLRRVRGTGVGQAHLKTGSLRDVAGVAGYVHAAGGRRFVLVAIVNHPQAVAARPAIEALIEWTARAR